MKRIGACCLLLICLLCAGCQGPSSEAVTLTRVNIIQTNLKVDLSKAELLSLTDSHGGFHGDGTMTACFQLDEETAASLKGRMPTRYWRRLPMTDDLHLLLFGGVRDGMTYLHEWAKEAGFPEPTEGCWIVHDKFGLYGRQKQAEGLADASRYTDRELMGRCSYNFWCAWIDDETGRLYYIEMDT